MNTSNRVECPVVSRQLHLRSLAAEHARVSAQLVEGLRSAAKSRLGNASPRRRGEALAFIRATEKISTLLAQAEVTTESLLTRLDVREI
jgi:hypothetical protein